MAKHTARKDAPTAAETLAQLRTRTMGGKALSIADAADEMTADGHTVKALAREVERRSKAGEDLAAIYADIEANGYGHDAATEPTAPAKASKATT